MARSQTTRQYLRATWNSFGELPNTYPAARRPRLYAPFQDDQRNFYQEFRLASKDAGFPDSSGRGGLFYSHLSENVPEDIIDPTLESARSLPTPALLTRPCRLYTGESALPRRSHLQRTDRPASSTSRLRRSARSPSSSPTHSRPPRDCGCRSSSYNGIVWRNRAVSWARRSSSSGGAPRKSPSHRRPCSPGSRITTIFSMSALARASARAAPTSAVGTICASNLTSLGLTQVPGQYASDSLWSYEIGSKNTFFDHRLQINASLFYIDWNNIQQNVYLPACGEQFTANLGKAKSEGGDIEVLYRPLDDADLRSDGGLHRCASHQNLVRGRLVLQRASDCVAGGLSAAPIASNGECAARSALVIYRLGGIPFSGVERPNDPICDSTYSIRLPSDPCYPSKIRTTHFTIRPFPGCRWSTTYRHEPVCASMRSTSRSTPTILRTRIR